MVARLRSRYLIRASLVLINLFSIAHISTSRGQDVIPANPEPKLAESVPSTAGIFVSISRLADLDRATKQAKVWRLLSFLGGHATTAGVLDLRAVVQSFLGSGCPIPADELMQCEVGLTADSFPGLANPIWFIRAADDAMLRRWFPQHSQQVGDAESARVLRTEDGRFVCIRGKIVVMAPRGSDWALLGSILRALAGADVDVLEKLPAYRESIAYLPRKPLVTIFMAGAAMDAPANQMAADHLAVGVYSKGGDMEFAFHGRRMQSIRQGPIDAAAMERMLKLPQTTLGAYITTVDWSGLSGQPNDDAAGTVTRFARLLKELGRANADSVAPKFGRHLIVAWGQDFSPAGKTPQFAALVETVDAQLVTRSAKRVAESLGRILSTLELHDVTPDLAMQENTHLGVVITSVPLRTYAEKSRFAWVKALAPLAPSWAASGNWFVVTLTPEHLNQILDAQIGFVGNLADQRDARTLRTPPQQDASAAFLQGSLAGPALRQWENSLRAGNAEGVFRQMWQREEQTDATGNQLGIELSDKNESGLVEVSTVSPSTPADGRLQPGDRILGVDGRLLEMVQPAADLQDWWEEASPGSSHTLRVLRGEVVLELEVTRRYDEVGVADLLAQPLDVLRELALLCDAIPSATLQIHNTGDQHFSALLRLRLDAHE